MSRGILLLHAPRSLYLLSIYGDAASLAPSRYAEGEGEVCLFGQREAEGDVAAEGIVGVFCDVAFGLAHLEVNLAGCVHGSHDGFVLATHPEAGSEVGHHAMHVAGAAFRLVCGSVGHPRRAAFEGVVVGVACADDLVDGREVLHGIEVGGDGSRSGIEDGTLYAVGPFGLACDGEEVAERPGIVRDVARLVSHVDVPSLHVFRAGRHAVGQHVVAFQLTFRVHGDAEVFLVARVGIEKQGYLQHLAVGDAMQVDELVAAGIGGVELESACLISRLGLRQQRLCASLAIEPKHTLEVEDVAATFREVVVRHGVVVAAKLCPVGGGKAVHVDVGFQCSPEDGLWPKAADDR